MIEYNYKREQQTHRKGEKQCLQKTNLPKKPKAISQ